MIDFKPITAQDRERFEKYLFSAKDRGCEYSFANLYLWGRQNAAILFDHLVLFSAFSRRTVYPFPCGEGDKKAVLDAIIADSKERGIPCRITGITAKEKEILEALYPGKFRFHNDRDSHDYVYDINDLADLKGKKYHSKRNHINRFIENHPNFSVEPLSQSNIDSAKKMVDEWYELKTIENPKSDFHMEKAAIKKALRDYEQLKISGLLLLDGGKVLAVTLGSPTQNNTFDVHFEKALPNVDGAYTVINCEFAKYIRSTHPEIEFFNREEDMGIEGLRKAKLSYRPHHMIEKCWACLLEDEYEY